MSSEENPTERKATTNETGRKTRKIDPRDVEQIRRNVRSNDMEREDSSSSSSGPPSR